MQWLALRIVLIFSLVLSGCVGHDIVVSGSPPCMLVECLSGGLAVFHEREFQSECSPVLPSGVATDLSISSTQRQATWQPLLHVYHQGNPFLLRLLIEDHSGQHEQIEIVQVTIENDEGLIRRENVLWNGIRFSPSGASDPVTSTEGSSIIQVRGRIDNLILEPDDLKITLTGYLINANGERIKFASTETLKSDSKFSVWPYWLILSGA